MAPKTMGMHCRRIPGRNRSLMAARNMHLWTGLPQSRSFHPFPSSVKISPYAWHRIQYKNTRKAQSVHLPTHVPILTQAFHPSLHNIDFWRRLNLSRCRRHLPLRTYHMLLSRQYQIQEESRFPPSRLMRESKWKKEHPSKPYIEPIPPPEGVGTLKGFKIM